MIIKFIKFYQAPEISILVRQRNIKDKEKFLSKYHKYYNKPNI